MSKIIKILSIEKEGDWIVANTPALDRDNDRIFPEKIVTTNFMKNPVLFWGHNYHDPWALIGKVAEWEVSKQSFRFRPEMRDPASENDPMNIIQSLWNNGLLRAASIGFMPKAWDRNQEGGRDYSEVELLEISLVPIPAHQDALRLALKAFGEDDTEYNGQDDPPDVEGAGSASDAGVPGDPEQDSMDEPTTDQPPHDASEDELEPVLEQLLNFVETLTEVYNHERSD